MMDQPCEPLDSLELAQLNQSQPELSLHVKAETLEPQSATVDEQLLLTEQPEVLEEQRGLTQMERMESNSREELPEQRLPSVLSLGETTTTVTEKPELSADAQPPQEQLQLVSNTSSTERLVFVTQLVTDITMPATEISEGTLASDAESKLLINLTDLEECNSADSYKSQQLETLSNSEQQLQLLPLDESYSLLDKIDMSGVLGESNNLASNLHLEEKLLSVLQDQVNWDIKVYIGQSKFYCQFIILQLFSPHFLHCKLAHPRMIRLPEEKVTAQAFNIIYNWMLYEKPTKWTNLSNRCIFEIYTSARFLGITELVDSICNTLDTIKNETEAFYLLSDMHNLEMPGFEGLFLSRISRFFLTLVASLEFVEMSHTSIKHLLNSHNLGVNSEIEVFYAAVRWFSHKWPQRQIHVPNLVGCVRFGLLPPMFLRYLQNPQSTRVMHCITSVPEVNDMINKAFIFASAERYCKNPPDQLLLHLPDYVIPEPRKWLFDRKCPYHHNLMCSQRQFFTYRQFLEYLEMLHHMKPNHWKRLKYLDEAIICCPR